MEKSSEAGDKFKEIFDLCDFDKDGYIDVKHFVELARDHFGGEGTTTEELTGIINLLDPEGRGIINFTDFSEGIKQILEIKQLGSRARFRSTSSEETLVSLDITGDTTVPGPKKTSPSLNSESTFAEYDLSGVEDTPGSEPRGSGTPPVQPTLPPPATELNGRPLIISGISEDDKDSVISGKSSEINENSRNEVTDEENYEDYGELESSEADFSDQGRLTPLSSTPRKRSDRREHLSRHHKKPCSNRRLTTAALASQLQRSGRNSPSSIRSYGSDEIFDDIDGNFQDVNGRLKFLEDHLQHLSQVQTETNNKQLKLKDENTVLVQKVHYLEEQLRDMEVRSDDRLSDERRKHQEYMARHERERTDQVDYVTQRLHRIEREYEELKDEAPRLHAEIAKLRNEKIDIQERLLEKQESYNVLYDDHDKLKSDYHRQEVLQDKERRATGQLIDEMGRELEDLRKFRREHEGKSPRGSISELPGRYRDLQNEIHKLREENRHLHDSNEELNAQLLNQCIGEGRSLIRPAEGQSLAEELEHLTKEELLEQLRMERDINFRLKQYVDKIIILILDKNPSLLEIAPR